MVSNLFKRIDERGLGHLTITEFEKHFDDESVQALFEYLQIGAIDAWTLFLSLDKDGDHTISVDEFTERCMQLHGPARSADIFTLRQSCAKLAKDLRRMDETQERMEMGLALILHQQAARDPPFSLGLKSAVECPLSGGDPELWALMGVAALKCEFREHQMVSGVEGRPVAGLSYCPKCMGSGSAPSCSFALLGNYFPAACIGCPAMRQTWQAMSVGCIAKIHTTASWQGSSVRVAETSGEPAKRQWKVLALLQAAGYFGNFDRTIFGIAVPQIQRDFALSDAQISYAASVLGLSSILASAISCLSDRYGRAQVLMWTLAPYTLATALTALSRSITSFVLLQLLAAAFITAEGIISHVIVLEEMPADCRGWAVGLLNTGSACGTGLGLLLFGVSDGAWRLMYALSILPLVGIGFIRRHLPETRRWSAANTLEMDKESAQEELEVQSLRLPPLTPLRLGSPTEEPTAAAKRCHLKRLSKVKRQHLFCILASFLGSFFPSAANFYASKQIQVVHGFGAAGFAKLSLIGGILALSAFIIAGYLGDRYGRKLLGVSGILLKAMTDFMFYSISPGKAYSVLLIVSVFCVRTALGMALDTTFQAMGGEVFPTSGRTSAQGLLVLTGGLGGPLGLLTATRLGDVLGTSEATRLMACGQIFTALIIAFGFPETHGRELEDINS
ncbi:nanT [Symbiodinium sp. CCMP2456]|nr:nanT [Symbiodinium sp. CCMP2456]